jgi:hypothetical protein
MCVSLLPRAGRKGNKRVTIGDFSKQVCVNQDLNCSKDFAISNPQMGAARSAKNRSALTTALVLDTGMTVDNEVKNFKLSIAVRTSTQWLFTGV